MIDFNQFQKMNQRSSSVSRKFKTQFNEDNGFDRRIQKMMHNKKESISKMITPRITNNNNTNSTKHHRPSNYNINNGYSYNYYGRNHDKSHIINLNTTNNNNQTKTTVHKNICNNTIDIDEQFINQFQTKVKAQTCSNHTNKPAAFQSINQNTQHKHKHKDKDKDRDSYYCYECAINMAKMNIKLNKITPESRIIKLFYDEQISRINEVEKSLKNRIEEYCGKVRQEMYYCYRQAHNRINDSNDRRGVIEFVNFEENPQAIRRIEDMIGNLQRCHLKFPSSSSQLSQQSEHKRQNNSNNYPKQINITLTQQELTSKQINNHNKQRQRQRANTVRNNHANYSLQIYSSNQNSNKSNCNKQKERDYSFYLKNSRERQKQRQKQNQRGYENGGVKRWESTRPQHKKSSLYMR